MPLTPRSSRSLALAAALGLTLGCSTAQIRTQQNTYVAEVQSARNTYLFLLDHNNGSVGCNGMLWRLYTAKDEMAKAIQRGGDATLQEKELTAAVNAAQAACR
jgi:hypothetical protein